MPICSPVYQGQAAQQGQQHGRREAGVREGPVAQGRGQAEGRRDARQARPAQVRQEALGQGLRVQGRIAERGQVVPQGLVVEEGEVRAQVVPHQHPVAGRGPHLGQHGVGRGGLLHHLLGDPGQLGDHGRHRAQGVDQRGVVLADLPPVQAHHRHFQDAVGLRPAPGGLHVQHRERRPTGPCPSPASRSAPLPGPCPTPASVSVSRSQPARPQFPAPSGANRSSPPRSCSTRRIRGAGATAAPLCIASPGRALPGGAKRRRARSAAGRGAPSALRKSRAISARCR